MADKAKTDNKVQPEAKNAAKPNSRVTRKHIEELLGAMDFAANNETDGYQRLGYLSFAVANVLKEVGYPKHYEEIAKRMWDNYGKK